MKVLRNETLEHGYATESTQRELFDDYQQVCAQNIFKIGCMSIVLPAILD